VVYDCRVVYVVCDCRVVLWFVIVGCCLFGL
jgi:hypothetical protein